MTLALSFRSGQADPAVMKSIEDRAGAAVTSIELQPLALDDCAELLVALERGGRPAPAAERRESVLPPAARRRRGLGGTDTGGRRTRRHRRAGPGEHGDQARARHALRRRSQRHRGRRGRRRPLRDRARAGGRRTASRGLHAGDRRARLPAADPPRRHAAAVRVPPPAGQGRDLRERPARQRDRAPPPRGEAADRARSGAARGRPPRRALRRTRRHGGRSPCSARHRDATATRAPSSAARWLETALELLPRTAPGRGPAGDPRRDGRRSGGRRRPRRRSRRVRGRHRAHPGGRSDARRADPRHRRYRAADREAASRRRPGWKRRSIRSATSPPRPAVSLKIALSTNGIYLDQREEMYVWGRRAAADAESLDSPLLAPPQALRSPSGRLSRVDSISRSNVRTKRPP